MKKIKKGDYVARISHNADILFKVEHIGEKQVQLKGVDLRLSADAPMEDLLLLSPKEVASYQQQYLRKSNDVLTQIKKRREKTIDSFLYRAKINYKKPNIKEQEIFELPGTILHLDGDKEYLDLCMNMYRQLNLRASGFCVAENEQANVIKNYILEYVPDILILTGHDGILKGKKNLSNPCNYRNSHHFALAVRKARELIPGKDDLIIFAGACQSHYESLILAGANFASSPRRVFIHAYDPVFIAEKVAYTPFYQMVPVKETVNDTITGPEGVGGIETHGRLRLGYPKSPY